MSFLCKLSTKQYYILGRLVNFPKNLICSFLRMKNVIVFESNPNFACNSFAVYKLIREDNRFKKYNHVWMVNDINVKNPLGVKLIKKYPKTLKEKISNYILLNRAKVIISCVTPYPKYKCSRKQLSIYLDHGSPLKGMLVDGKPEFRLFCDYIISQAKFFNPYIAKTYDIDEKMISVTGIPRNDQFFSSEFKLETIYPNIKEYKKVIAWVPTFRKTISRCDCSFEYPFGLPILYKEEDFDKLNEVLNGENTLLVMKPHPACDLSSLKTQEFSNIKFLTNKEMLDHDVQTNEFLKCCDAMITDYSGIYYDYLLTDKPIGITLDDFDVYNREHGFIIDNPLDILQGYKINKVDDFVKFVFEVSNGIDSSFESRNKIKTLTNDFLDDNSSKRVVDFIYSKLKQ